MNIAERIVTEIEAIFSPEELKNIDVEKVLQEVLSYSPQQIDRMMNKPRTFAQAIYNRIGIMADVTDPNLEAAIDMTTYRIIYNPI